MDGAMILWYSHTNDMAQLRFFANGECPGVPGRASVKDEVTVLSAEMLRCFCETNNYSYSTGKDGNVRLSLDYSEERDPVLKVRIDRSGKSGTILCVRVISDRRYDADRLDEVLRAISEYHIEKRWPKVYAEAKGKALLITCEMQLDAAMGIH